MKVDLRDLAAGLVHAAMQDGISERGEQECAYFAGHLESITIAFKAYVDALADIELTKEKLLANCHLPLSPAQEKAVERECKLIVREINLRHKQTISVFDKWLKEFDRMKEETKDFCYDATDSN